LALSKPETATCNSTGPASGDTGELRNSHIRPIPRNYRRVAAAKQLTNEQRQFEGKFLAPQKERANPSPEKFLPYLPPIKRAMPSPYGKRAIEAPDLAWVNDVLGARNRRKGSPKGKRKSRKGWEKESGQASRLSLMCPEISRLRGTFARARPKKLGPQ